MNKKLLVLSLLSYLCLLVACGGGSTTTSTTLNTPPPTPPPSLAITSTALPSGKTGDSYEGNGFQLAASGGVAPYQWKWVAVPGFSTPDGLEIAANGLISGTPRTPGTFDVVITVLDAESPSAQVSQTYTITIEGPLALAINSGAPPNGAVGVDYGPTVTEYFSCRWSPVLGWHQVCIQCTSYASCASLPICRGAVSPIPCRSTRTVFLGFTFTAAGGTSPYTWAASGLPPGVDLDPSTGQLTGTPTEAGSYSFTISLTDSQAMPSQASANYTIEIANATANALPDLNKTRNLDLFTFFDRLLLGKSGLTGLVLVDFDYEM